MSKKDDKKNRAQTEEVVPKKAKDTLLHTAFGKATGAVKWVGKKALKGAVVYGAVSSGINFVSKVKEYSEQEPVQVEQTEARQRSLDLQLDYPAANDSEMEM